MPAKLILSLNNSVLGEFPLDKERIILGRKAENDIQVDNLAVSGQHAAIITILNDSFLEDLDSTNGTYVNGKLVKKHALKNGDVITIGKHELKYVNDEASDEDDEFEKTMIIRPGAQTGAPSMDRVQDAVASAGAAPSAPPPSANGQTPHPTQTQTIHENDVAVATLADNKSQALPKAKLQVLSGAFAGKELALTKALTTLGRPGVQVAAITRRAEGYFVVHVDSGKAGNYPLVNGRPIGPQARKLNDNDVIELAGVKMGFFST